MFLLTSLITTFTCGFGGASIRAAESAPGVDSLILKTHAWTAMTVFLLSVLMALYSYRAIRGKGEEVKNDKTLFAVSLIFLVVFVTTTIIAYKIR
jgi:heme O synthase-like polyprenyltransferase